MNKNLPTAPVRMTVAVLALLGLAGVLPVSVSEFEGSAFCPRLAGVPACYVVLASYFVLLASAAVARLWRAWGVVAALAIIVLLAAAGSALEITGHGTCPQTTSGIPKCYLSLALGLCIATPILFHLGRRHPLH